MKFLTWAAVGVFTAGAWQNPAQPSIGIGPRQNPGTLDKAVFLCKGPVVNCPKGVTQMDAVRNDVVIDLFSHPMSERRMRRESAPLAGAPPISTPARGPAPASPKKGLAPVVDLFASKASDSRHFGRIQEILAVRIAKDRLFVELYVDGPALPERYLRTLTATVEDPLTGVNTRVNFEAIKVNGHYVGMRSEPLKGGLKGGGEGLQSNALVRITSTCGRMIQNLIQPLLNAKP